MGDLSANDFYQQFTSRNLGFVTPEDQEKLRRSVIFIPGVGGMGGTALEVLARSGIENFLISDPDVFEVSNLNRQIFGTSKVIGQSKSKAALERIKAINPHLNIQIIEGDWTVNLDQILPKVSLVVNGCDDHRATVQLMRKAKQHQKTVIDAFASTLPSVYVVRPQDPRPEEFLDFPTLGKNISEVKEEDWQSCARQETLYVLVHSSTIKHVVMKYAAEMVQGKRKRISMAPMVWMTGLLMSYEATKELLGLEKQVGPKGVFLNPWTLKYEHPSSYLIAAIKKFFIKIFLKKLQS